MKMKYTAALALAAWLLVVGWLASMVVAKPAVLRIGNQAEDSAAMVELRNAIARNRKTMDGIGTLRDRGMPYQASQSLIALPTGVADDAVAGEIAASTTSAQAAAVEPHLSLVLDTGSTRIAIFNGEQVRRGSRLADGGRVHAIGPDWISVSGTDRKRNVYRVRPQFETFPTGIVP